MFRLRSFRGNSVLPSNILILHLQLSVVIFILGAIDSFDYKFTETNDNE